jgi:F-type H+-transporting ATPase subunit delta
MLAQEVAHKYAMALFQAAREKQVLEMVHDELQSLRQVIRSDKALLNFLSAPQVLEESKAKMLRDTFENRINQLLVEFLIVLVHKHRVKFLDEIIDEFEDLYEEEMGIGRATVITAVPMTENERSSITTRIAAQTGKKILLQEKVDPAIIGGMVTMFDGDIIDGSVRHSLSVLKDQLSHLRVH